MRNVVYKYFVLALVALSAACGGGGGNAFLGDGGGSSGSGSVRISDLEVVFGGSEIVADGSSSVFVRAVVTGTDGAPFSGQAVSFSTNAGSLSSTAATTDSNGIAQVFLTSSTNATRATMTVSVPGIVSRDSVDFVAGDPVSANSSISANPGSLPADGTSEATITVIATDQFGNSVEDGTSVQLLATAGEFVGGDTQLASQGRASFVLRAPSTAEEGQLSVEVDGRGIEGLSQTISFGTVAAGDPVAVEIDTASPSTITVKEVGRGSTSNLTFTVIDSAGAEIDEDGYGRDTLNNVQLCFVTRPNGGETISGTDADGVSQTTSGNCLQLRTSNGAGVVTLNSGTLPGAVELQVQVLKFDGTDFAVDSDVAVAASLPQVVIASGPPETLVFTSSNLNAIVDQQQGVYARNGKILVTDKYGNSVPDGTVISLGYVDSVVAHTAEASVAAASPALSAASSLISLRCTSSIACVNESFDFESTISRNNTDRGIEQGFRALVLDAAAIDKARFVQSVAGADDLTVQSNYQNADADMLAIVGASLSGSSVAGIDAQNEETAGSASTTNGVASFIVKYPANVGTILSGCYGYELDESYTTDDKRWDVPQSAQSWVVAISSETQAVGISQGDFCFAAIAGGTMEATPTSIKGGSGTSTVISLDVKDGGDQISLPFVPVSASVEIDNIESNSQFSVVATVLNNAENQKPQTDIVGVALGQVNVNGPACNGDKATVTFRGFDASATVTVEVTQDEADDCGA